MAEVEYDSGAVNVRVRVGAAAPASADDPVQQLAHEQSLAGRERRRVVQMSAQADRERG